ncbi:MAG: SulP family inorganic anion transporter [Rikenellaceae bacterium]
MTFLARYKGYNFERFMADLMAGLIVSVVALPLSIAFAIASGVSPEVGIVTGIIGGIVVSLLGGTSVQIGGPTGAFIVILSGIIAQYGIGGLLLATFMAGVILVAMGVLKLGAAIKFIPYPINVGFTSGIALTIFTSQVPDLFGFEVTGGASSLPSDFIGKWLVYFDHFSGFDPLTLCVGLATILLIVTAPKVLKGVPGSLVALVVMGVSVFALERCFGIGDVTTIGDRYSFGGSLPSVKGFSVTFDMVRDIMPSALTIALLVAIESLLSATVADGALGERHNSNKELIAQGVSNMVVPFFGGIPVTGAVARTMTNVTSGGRTPVAGIVNGVVLLMMLLFLAPLMAHIPMVCLAGVLAVVSYNMSEWRTFKSMLRGTKSDVTVLVGTFFLTVFFDLTVAIIVGILMAMVLFMRRVAEVTEVSVVRDKLNLSDEDESSHNDEVLDIASGVEVYHIDGPFFFGVASKFDAVISRVSEAPKVRVIRMRRVPFMDSTGLYNLQLLVKSSQSNGIKIILSGVNSSVRKSLMKARFDDFIGSDCICDNIHIALKRSVEYLKSIESDIE